MIYFRVVFLEDLVTDAFLSRVADNLGNVFFRLGLLLGVARPCIERLENNYVRDTWRITYEVLVNWRETSVNKSNVVVMMEDLIGAMTELKLNDVAEDVRHGECRTEPWHPLLLHCCCCCCCCCCDMTKPKWNVASCGNHICLIVRSF